MNAADYLKNFAEPDPRYTPVPAWWWSGEPLRLDKMRWQMDQMRLMGLRNFVVIGLAPSGAMFGSDADDPPFLSEAWWDVFCSVCDYARELDMFVWFYDQIGFSGANFQTDLVAAHPEWSAQRLKSVVAEGAGWLELRCPDIGTPLAGYVIEGDQVRPAEVVDRWVRAELTTPGRLRLVYSVRQAYDYFNPAACQALLDTVHREYARRLPQHVGKTIVGSYQDELPELPTWGKSFADTFEIAFGYRLENVIHRLFEPGDASARRTRLHFHQHRANLAEAAFFKPFFDWHQSHGLQCGYDQQSPAREARVLGCIEKYADYMQTQRWYALPGSDLHGNGKLHSSIAFLNGRPRVWLEGFHTSGWGGTIADTFDWLLPYLQSGVTLYNPHAVYYSTQKGWWEWAPPSTCWRQPYAMHYRGFADMIARLTKLLSRGVHQASVGVLFPTATAQSHIGAENAFDGAKQADDVFHRVLGSMRWHQVQTGALDADAIDHHVLDEASIQFAAIDGTTLLVRGVPLQAIVLPAITMLASATLAKLKTFAAGGGRVVAIASDEVETEDASLAWANVAKVTCLSDVSGLAMALAGLPQPVRAEVPFLHRRDGDTNILFVPAVSGMATVVKWDSWFAPMEHTTIVPERYRQSVRVEIQSAVGQLWRFDPIDGSSCAIATDRTGNTSKADLDFDGAPMAVLVWSEDEPPAAEAVPAVTVRRQMIDVSWRCDYVPTLPEPFADIYNPQQPSQRFPTTSQFNWIVATADSPFERGLPPGSERVSATFGVRGQIEYSDGRRVPLTYSPQYGIDHDKLHQLTLGPKAHVPEEFIDLGKMTAGKAATIQFSVRMNQPQHVLLIVGANAAKQVRIDHREHVATGNEYAWQLPLELAAGENAIELTLTALSNSNVRAFWCFAELEDATLHARPERLVTPAKPAFGQRLRYIGLVRNATPILGGTLQVSSAAQLQVSVAGRAVGRQGGFDPYRLQMRGQRYAVPPLPAGVHEIVVEVAAPALVAPVLVDAELQTEAGPMAVLSDATWRVSIDEAAPIPVAIHPKQDADGAAWHLRRRPHPLPQSAWLDGGRPGVLDLPMSPPSAQPVSQWFQWTVPPGAVTVRVPLVDMGRCDLWLDGEHTPFEAGAEVALPRDNRASRLAVLRATSRQSGGGVLAGAVTYTFDSGTLRLGNWMEQGLSSYSGAIRMRADINRPIDSSCSLAIDLGRVRGTVEMLVNGQPAGVRWISPYRFNVGPHLRPGRNVFDLIVTNTLANHLSTWSPTRCWSPDQLDCGIFGPIEWRITGSTP